MATSKAHLKEQAKQLYLTTNKTQRVIGAILGVTEQTISAWAKKETWALTKQALYYSPDAELQQLYQSLRLINESINKRKPEERVPTKEELEAKSKILAMIAGPLKKIADSWRNIAPEFDVPETIASPEEVIPGHTTVFESRGKEVGRITAGDIKMRQRMPNGLYAYDIRDMHDYYIKVAKLVIAADMDSWPKDAGKEFVPTGLQTLLDGMARKEKEEAEARRRSGSA